jgi:hypothetical protein
MLVAREQTERYERIFAAFLFTIPCRTASFKRQTTRKHQFFMDLRRLGSRMNKMDVLNVLVVVFERP